MSFEAYLVAAFAVVLTGISKSGLAGGLGILGVPLVALTMSPQDAAVLLLPILIGIDILSVWRYRKAWQARMIVALLPGAMVGILLGMISFSSINSSNLRIAIGLMALGFVANYVLRNFRSTATEPTNNWAAVFIVSALSGFAGFVAHAGGPLIKGTLLRMQFDKTAFVGSNALFFFTLNIAKGVGYAALGLFSTDGLLASASLTPFLFLGVGIGFALHDRIAQKTFVRLAYVLLVIAGFNLLYIGFASL